MPFSGSENKNVKSKVNIHRTSFSRFAQRFPYFIFIFKVCSPREKIFPDSVKLKKNCSEIQYLLEFLWKMEYFLRIFCSEMPNDTMPELLTQIQLFWTSTQILLLK